MSVNALAVKSFYNICHEDQILRHMLNPDFITISTVSIPLLKHVILSRIVGLQF